MIELTEKSLADIPSDPSTEDQRWRRVSENISQIALQKSDAMTAGCGPDDETFDRDARVLRALMSSAEIAKRMRRDDEKEKRLDDERAAPRAYSDAEIRALYRRVVDSIDNLEAADAADPGDAGAARSGDGGTAGAANGEELVEPGA